MPNTQPRHTRRKKTLHKYRPAVDLSAKLKTVETQAVHKIYSALENPNFKWRTISGISKETGIQTEIIERALSKISVKIVRSDSLSTTGEQLYTTRSHYLQKESILGRFVAALKNRAA
jgi:hypothetical protein